jgi:hypothetical protein
MQPSSTSSIRGVVHIALWGDDDQVGAARPVQPAVEAVDLGTLADGLDQLSVVRIVVVAGGRCQS